jgi:hypothetical protein
MVCSKRSMPHTIPIGWNPGAGAELVVGICMGCWLR